MDNMKALVKAADKIGVQFDPNNIEAVYKSWPCSQRKKLGRAEIVRQHLIETANNKLANLEGEHNAAIDRAVRTATQQLSIVQHEMRSVMESTEEFEAKLEGGVELKDEELEELTKLEREEGELCSEMRSISNVVDELEALETVEGEDVAKHRYMSGNNPPDMPCNNGKVREAYQRFANLPTRQTRLRRDIPKFVEVLKGADLSFVRSAKTRNRSKSTEPKAKAKPKPKATAPTKASVVGLKKID